MFGPLKNTFAVVVASAFLDVVHVTAIRADVEAAAPDAPAPGEERREPGTVVVTRTSSSPAPHSSA